VEGEGLYTIHMTEIRRVNKDNYKTKENEKIACLVLDLVGA